MNLELYKIDNQNELMKVEKLLQLQNTVDLELLQANDVIKQLKERSESVKQDLLNAMTKYDIKSLETERFKITRVNETTKKTIDSKKLKEEYPDVYEKYSKESTVKAYLKITEKKGE